ncbi:hypothetical protein ANN_27074 [Periplaneta americana]|uniref:Uncharacterized protein n=1 Tax=Periplaneta americana TaxID=6978 RepID=A0ABQ8RX91_PERAM|nr:hypothetical protein ANN_27074 [Periplaneta americana]
MADLCTWLDTSVLSLDRFHLLGLKVRTHLANEQRTNDEAKFRCSRCLEQRTNHQQIVRKHSHPLIIRNKGIYFRHPFGEIELSAAFCYELQASGKSRPQRIPTSFDVPTSDGSLPKANQMIGLPLLRRTHLDLVTSKGSTPVEQRSARLTAKPGGPGSNPGRGKLPG